jgi:CRISPR-associated endoribonuclease Cas6
VPNRWWIPVAGINPDQVSADDTHGAFSRWFDYTKAEHHAPFKPFTIAKDLTQNGEFGVIITTLTDEAERRLTIAGHRITTVELANRSVHVGQRRHLDHTSWAHLDVPTGAHSWEIEFLSPATFRHGDDFSTPWPHPPKILRGLTDTWAVHSELPPRAPTHQQLDHIWVSALDGHSRDTGFRGMAGFIGHVGYRCDNPDTADLIDPLLRLAAYSGVGTATARGLGVVRLRATANTTGALPRAFRDERQRPQRRPPVQRPTHLG